MTRSIDTGTDQLLAHVDERVGVITLNRPEARNALSDELTPALRAMVARFTEDDAVGALLITGAGTAFCAGGDVKGMATRGIGRAEMTTNEKIEQLKVRQRTLTGALHACGKPTIAALPGPAAGAGLAIALACDIRIAAETAFVSTGYARVGLSGDYGVAWLLTRAIGSARARQLMFTAERVPADRCEAIGLVNLVFADDAFQSESLAFAKRLAAGPMVAFRSIKQNLDLDLEVDFGQALDGEAERLIASAQTEDHKEAVRAFVEKREPVFTGR